MKGTHHKKVHNQKDPFLSKTIKITSKRRKRQKKKGRVELPVTNKDKTGQVKSFTLTITLEAKPLTTPLIHTYNTHIKQERY